MIWDDVQVGDYFKRTCHDNSYCIGKVVEISSKKILKVKVFYSIGKSAYLWDTAKQNEEHLMTIGANRSFSLKEIKEMKRIDKKEAWLYEI